MPAFLFGTPIKKSDQVGKKRLQISGGIGVQWLFSAENLQYAEKGQVRSKITIDH